VSSPNIVELADGVARMVLNTYFAPKQGLLGNTALGEHR